MSSTLPIFSLIAKSGPVALLVLGILFALSIGLWTVVLLKVVRNRAEGTQVREWFKLLARNRNLAKIKEASVKLPESSYTRVARAAIGEIEGLAPFVSFKTLAPRHQLIDESLEKAIDKEKYLNEKYLSFLALCASVAPFLGLFGTVWGIMHSFLDIGQLGSANITVVAPGIAEALITTIVGLSVAIPAAAAYNYLVSKNKQAEAGLYDFGYDIAGLFKRHELRALEKSENAAGS